MLLAFCLFQLKWLEKYKSNQSITVKTKKGERLEVSVEKGQGKWKCVDNKVEYWSPESREEGAVVEVGAVFPGWAPAWL